MNFLDYYKQNLAFIRNLGSEFAAEFPKIASRLELTSLECADPFVERFLEGCAFLSARVEQKLDSGFPRLLESILSSVAPASVQNLPSYCVLELQEKRRKIFLPAGSRFQTAVPGVKTPCTYSSMQACFCSGISVEELKYHTRDTEEFEFSAVGGLSAIGMKLTASSEPQQEGEPDELTFYLDLPDGEASLLMELFAASLVGVYAADDSGKMVKFSEISAIFPAFDLKNDQDAVIPGLDKLIRFLAYPPIFKFITFGGISEYFKLTDGKRPLYFVFSRRVENFLHKLNAELFRTGCFPAANIFPKKADRCGVGCAYEYHIVPERTAPLDYEVYKVLSVEVLNDSNRTLFHCRSLYNREWDISANEDDAFVLHRRERPVPKNRNSRSSYTGTEVFLSFSGRNWREQREQISQIQPELLCTNRDLPLLLNNRAVFTAVEEGKLQAVPVSVPSRPGAPLISGGGKEDWDKVGFLSFNISSMLYQPGDLQIQSLRELIRSYSVRSKEESEHLAEGILSLVSVPRKFRFVEQGCVFYENGWHVTVTLREKSYEGIGVFFFALVLRDVLRSYQPLNACMKLTVISDLRGEIISWKL